MYAKTPDEVVICQDAELSRLDREITINAYQGGFRAFVRRTQAAWLNNRHRCGYDTNRISNAYANRFGTL